MTRQTPKRSILVVAPHLEFPLRNGADIYIAKKWAAAAVNECKVTIIANTGVFVAVDGAWQLVRQFASLDARFPVLQFILSSHGFMAAKYDVERLAAEVQTLRNSCDLIVLSFVALESICASINEENDILIELHNLDFKIYLDRSLETHWLKRSLYQEAAARAYRDLLQASRRPNVNLCALGRADALTAAAICQREIIESQIGWNDSSSPSPLPDIFSPSIIFTGALDLQMNTVAIEEFISNDWPKLKAIIPELKFVVAGRNPGNRLRRICTTLDISIIDNPSDDEMRTLVCNATASIIPFRESNGLKLKFATATSAGTPSLSFLPLPDEIVKQSLGVFSTDMIRWAHFLKESHARAPRLELRRRLLELSEKNSWSQVVQNTLATLSSDDHG